MIRPSVNSMKSPSLFLGFPGPVGSKMLRSTSKRSGVGRAVGITDGSRTYVAVGSGTGSEVEHAATRRTVANAATMMRWRERSVITPPLYRAQAHRWRVSTRRIA